MAGDACKLPSACTNTEAINDMKKFVAGSKKAAKASKVGALDVLLLPVLLQFVHLFTNRYVVSLNFSPNVQVAGDLDRSVAGAMRCCLHDSRK